MALNFGQLQTEVFNRGFTYLNDGGTGLARVQRWINEAYQEICDLEPWPFLEKTATGAAPLTIADLRDISTCVNSTDNVQLEHKPRKWLLEAYGNLATVGTPQFYYVESLSIVKTYPVKSVAPSLTVYYWNTPADLSLSTDTPVIPSRYHEIIVAGAVRRAYEDMDDPQGQGLINQEWQTTLTAMRHALLDQYPRQRRYATVPPDRAEEKE